MESVDEILLETDDKMSKSLDMLKEQFSGMRTGKASPHMVENVSVIYYGAPTRLRELANISTPEPRLIVINPYDKNARDAVVKAIHAANLGFSPMDDGRVIRIPIPELSEERRKEMTKVMKRMAEEARVSVRNVRRDMNEAAKKLQKDSGCTEDERDKGLEDIQKSTNDYIGKIDAMVTAKETELMQV
jgi:ribosome recycling factor